MWWYCVLSKHSRQSDASAPMSDSAQTEQAASSAHANHTVLSLLCRDYSARAADAAAGATFVISLAKFDLTTGALVGAKCTIAFAWNLIAGAAIRWQIHAAEGTCREAAGRQGQWPLVVRVNEIASSQLH